MWLARDGYFNEDVKQDFVVVYSKLKYKLQFKIRLQLKDVRCKVLMTGSCYRMFKQAIVFIWACYTKDEMSMNSLYFLQ